MKIILTFIRVASELLFFLIVALSLHQTVSSEEISSSTCRHGQRAGGQTLEQIGKEKYRQYVLKAKSNVAVFQPETSLQFPLGVTCPFKVEEQSERTGDVQTEQLVAVGFVNQLNQPKPITSVDLNEMFDRNLRSLDASREPHSNQTSPRSGRAGSNRNSSPPTDRQRSDIPVINLIAFNTRTKQTYLIPDVDFMSIYRDALNAALNNELGISNLDLNQLNPDTPNQQQSENLIRI